MDERCDDGRDAACIDEEPANGYRYRVYSAPVSRLSPARNTLHLLARRKFKKPISLSLYLTSETFYPQCFNSPKKKNQIFYNTLQLKPKKQLLEYSPENELCADNHRPVTTALSFLFSLFKLSP